MLVMGFHSACSRIVAYYLNLSYKFNAVFHKIICWIAGNKFTKSLSNYYKIIIIFVYNIITFKYNTCTCMYRYVYKSCNIFFCGISCFAYMQE